METQSSLDRLGAKLRAFRKESGYTLKDAADYLEVTSPFLSMVENGKSGIRFENLHRLLTLYEKNLGDLTAGQNSERDPVLNVSSAPAIATGSGVELYGLSSRTHEEQGYMGGFLLSIAPGALNAYNNYGALEYVYVIRGDIHLTLKETEEERMLRLSAGDTATHWTGKQHVYQNVGKEPAQVLIVQCRHEGKPGRKQTNGEADDNRKKE